ncbi:MAG: hypothetical protein JO306_08560 [Gemmatimonadetes bacterium]|nr:hypothetical protein [Gemmatimonadota bacterium]
MIDDDDPDAPLKEIWEIRRRISEEFGYDRKKYFQYLMELQNTPELRSRLVTLDELNRRRHSGA